MIETQLTKLDKGKRVFLSRVVGRLYTLRIDAGYKPSVTVKAREAREAISLMRCIFEES